MLCQHFIACPPECYLAASLIKVYATVKWFACWIANRKVRGSNPGQGRNLVQDFRYPVANSAMTGTLTALCQWEDQTARERTGHPTLYAEVKKMKSLTLCTHGYSRASLIKYKGLIFILFFLIKNLLITTSYHFNLARHQEVHDRES